MSSAFRLRVAALCLCLTGLGLAPSSQAAEPHPVVFDLRLENGNWYPLPERDMKRAASDPALAELSKAGLLRIVETDPKAGTLDLEVSLVGPAEVAKLTITLGLPGRPTVVSTASISVRNMDYQDIYHAFEHIGRTAAERLNAKVTALGPVPARIAPEPVLPNDPKLQADFDEAQRLKHAAQYQQARIRFERVVAASERGDRLRVLAEEELRYGLPSFEAKQGMVAFGSLGNQPAAARATLVQVENLMRQVLAENTTDLTRVQEAQRFLDDLAVARGALENAYRAQAMSRAHTLRMWLMEHLMMMGECGDEPAVSEMLDRMPPGLRLDAVESIDGAGTRYTVVDESSGVPVRLVCDRDVRLER